jgi:Putative beta barrel porin-7 (BBP7)
VLSTPDAGTGTVWYEVLGSESVPTAELERGVPMKKIGTVPAVLAGVVALTSSANASFSDCSSIANPTKRLACYDKAANAAGRSAKPAAVNPDWDTPSNAKPAKAIAKASPPVKSVPRFWFEADAGFYGFFRNVQGVAPTAPPDSASPIPTSPGFIGLYSISTVTNPPPNPINFGGGANYEWGYWLNPQRTMALEGSIFFGLGYSNSYSGRAVTTTFVNTTPDVFVGLFNDNTTAATGAIWDVLYGVDANYRMTLPHFYAPYVTNFDVLVGWRYIGLDEFTFSSSSVFTRTFQPGLGLPPPSNAPVVNSSRPRLFGVANNFFGPQAGFNVEQHWGQYWVKSENKVAVGGTIEPVWSGPTSVSTTPTQPFTLAGIPLVGNNGGTPVTGVDRKINVDIKGAFTVVPSGTLKIGYDIIPDERSLTLAYNYLYMSQVGLIAVQSPSPVIRQSSFFAQGITFGYKQKF